MMIALSAPNANAGVQRSLNNRPFSWSGPLLMLWDTAWLCRCCSGSCSRGVFSARRGDAVVERRAMVDGIRHADRYWMSAGVSFLDATRARPAVGSRWYTASTVGARLSHRTRLCGRDSTFCDAWRISWNGVDLRVRSGANTHRPFASRWGAL